MKNTFTVDVGGDPKHDDLTAEIYCGDNPVNDFFAMINQDAGVDKLEIEIHPRKDGQPWVLDLGDLLQTIQRAKERLYELRRSE